MLNKLSKFTYDMALDLITSYYNISLTDAVNNICATATPFGKNEYNRIAMGVWIAPDIFRERMDDLVENLESVRVYLDDFLIVASGSLEEYLSKVKEVTKWLHLSDLKFKIDRWKFAVSKVEYLR